MLTLHQAVLALVTISPYLEDDEIDHEIWCLHQEFKTTIHRVERIYDYIEGILLHVKGQRSILLPTKRVDNHA